MGWDEEDVHMGESLRGMQDSHVGNFSEIGAAQARLRGALGQLAHGRFTPHAPVSKQMRSPYKDSTQISISLTGTFTLDTWSGSVLPTISGLTRVYKSFKPNKAILTELVILTFHTTSLGDATRAVNVRDAADLVLVQAFSGADNCFPNAPNEANGIAGPVFSNVSLGNGISWPTINGGIDMSIGLAVESTVIYSIDPPSGYTFDDISSIQVKARFGLLGPSLR